jgi:hypothetical protein
MIEPQSVQAGESAVSNTTGAWPAASRSARSFASEFWATIFRPSSSPLATVSGFPPATVSSDELAAGRSAAAEPYPTFLPLAESLGWNPHPPLRNCVSRGGLWLGGVRRGGTGGARCAGSRLPTHHRCIGTGSSVD